MKSQTFRTRIFHIWFLLTRPMTLGVRLIVRDDINRILLVRHSYVKGWYLPGGGVEKNETADETARKELMEETGLEVCGDLNLIGVFANHKTSKRDHVLLYSCPEWREASLFKPNAEIVEIGFFDLDDLPADTTGSTRARLREIFENKKQAAYW